MKELNANDLDQVAGGDDRVIIGVCSMCRKEGPVKPFGTDKMLCDVCWQNVPADAYKTDPVI